VEHHFRVGENFQGWRKYSGLEQNFRVREKFGVGTKFQDWKKFRFGTKFQGWRKIQG